MNPTLPFLVCGSPSRQATSREGRRTARKNSCKGLWSSTWDPGRSPWLPGPIEPGWRRSSPLPQHVVPGPRDANVVPGLQHVEASFASLPVLQRSPYAHPRSAFTDSQESRPSAQRPPHECPHRPSTRLSVLRGGVDVLVGRSRECGHPVEAEALPSPTRGAAGYNTQCRTMPGAAQRSLKNSTD